MIRLGQILAATDFSAPARRAADRAARLARVTVVLGRHGQSATEDLLGSVSKHVLADGSTDVLVSTARET